VGTTSKQWIFTDQLGSTIAMADSTANALARTYTYTYTPDGDPTTAGTGPTIDVQFAGGQRIGSLYPYGARYHDPATATWTQQDPINQFASLAQANHYNYVGANGVNETDPDGAATANGRCIRGRPNYAPTLCRRAGLKTVSEAEAQNSPGVNPCVVSLTSTFLSAAGTVLSIPSGPGVTVGAAGTATSAYGAVQSC
jgi:RHS repeat-associated protein